MTLADEQVGGEGADGGCFSRSAVEGVDGEAGSLVFFLRRSADRTSEQLFRRLLELELRPDAALDLQLR